MVCSKPLMAAIVLQGLEIKERLRLVDDSVAGSLVIDGTFSGTVSSPPGCLEHWTDMSRLRRATVVATDHTVTFTR